MTGLTKFKFYRNTLSVYYTHQSGSWRKSLKLSIANLDRKRQDEMIRVLSRNQNLSEFFPNEWDFVAQRKKIVDNVIQDFFRNHSVYPSISDLRLLVKSAFNNGATIQNDDLMISSFLLSAIEKFICERKIEVENKQISIHTIKDLFSFRNSIIDYEKSYGTRYILRDLNEDWVLKLFSFFREERKIKDGYLTKGNLKGKTLKKRFDTLKQLLKWLHKKNILIPETVVDRVGKLNYKNFQEDAVKYALNDEQLRLIREVELEEGSPQCKARDMFMVVCYTGMRFGDLTTLNRNHIISVGDLKVLVRKAQKTAEKEYKVELPNYVHKIMQKYDYRLNLMSNDKANQYIKEVLAGIDEFCIDVPKYEYKFRRVPRLWELISFHQGRRTFITNLIKRDLGLYEVQKRTDHKKIRTLEEYISPDKENFLNPETIHGII
jgi:integrase